MTLEALRTIRISPTRQNRAEKKPKRSLNRSFSCMPGYEGSSGSEREAPLNGKMSKASLSPPPSLPPYQKRNNAKKQGRIFGKVVCSSLSHILCHEERETDRQEPKKNENPNSVIMLSSKQLLKKFLVYYLSPEKKLS